MKQFIMKHKNSIQGVISGFDRLVFHGTLRKLASLKRILPYLYCQGVLLKDFGNYAQALTDRIRETTQSLAKARGIEIRFLPSPRIDKEDIARQVAAERRISEGPICILSTQEMCPSYEVHRDRETKRLQLKNRMRPGLCYYHYHIHPIFGFMHARIHTWIPFPIQIYINGREWLSRQLTAAGLGFTRRENCFVWLEDPQQAQRLLDLQLRVSWPKLLDEIAFELNPAHQDMFKRLPVSYYWTTYQSEWATDALFRDAESLAKLYPRLVHHGMTSFRSPDVMRFLGRKGPSEHSVPPAFKGEVVTILKRRPEGVRIKHAINKNSIKLYDKQGSVLRVETTINDSYDLMVYRPKEGQSDGPKAWRPMRKGIADLHRRASLCQASNERYLDALAAVSDDATLAELTRDMCRPLTVKGKRFRAIRPWDDKELKLLQAITRGEFLITGFRNRDIAPFLFPAVVSATPKEKKRISAAVSYRLRLLRAHGLIKKVQHTHRYFLTKKGQRVVTAVLAAHQATITQLTKEAA
jgi:hypothetical protein